MSNINRGPKASITLNFAGNASPNPGKAACSFVAIIQETLDNKPADLKIQRGIPLGHTTNSAAEYHGLIAGLRAVHRCLQIDSIRSPSVDLQVIGHSDVVINHMSARSRVNSDNLYPLFAIAFRLTTGFLRVNYQSCPRSQNSEAETLAKKARERPGDMVNRAVYCPSLANFTDVWVGEERVLGSHDLLTAGSDPSFCIDASFLRSLPEGDLLLANSRDPYPLSVRRIIAQYPFSTYLGIMRLPVQLLKELSDGIIAFETVLFLFYPIALFF